DVGDRYVMEKMRNDGYNFGGEQSGHVIFLDNSTSGDGMLTAVQLLNIMKETGKKLSELADGLTIYPQVLENVPVEDKQTALHHHEIVSIIESVRQHLGDTGRVLVRPSGTESLIRVMIEAETEEICRKYIDDIVEVVKRFA